MEKLTIELDCNKKTCGKCKLAVKSSMGTACGLYVQRLEEVKGNYRRLPECIDACKAQNKTKK